jgi:hypothetical protein
MLNGFPQPLPNGDIAVEFEGFVDLAEFANGDNGAVIQNASNNDVI